jgi:hypothetical protein
MSHGRRAQPAYLSSAGRQRQRSVMPRVARSREHEGQGHSSRAGIMEGDQHATFPPLPGDRHPAAGHPLLALRPHPRPPARQHQRGPDRALPPGPSRSPRHPRPVTEPRDSPAGDATADVRQIRDELAAGLALGAGDHGAESAADAPARVAAVRCGHRVSGRLASGDAQIGMFCAESRWWRRWTSSCGWRDPGHPVWRVTGAPGTRWPPGSEGRCPGLRSVQA